MVDFWTSDTRIERARVVVPTLLVALLSMSAMAIPVAAQDESAAPTASPTAAEAACESASDLEVIVGFIGDSLESESGLLPVGIGVIAGLSEAQTLTQLVADVYRPLVDDLILSLQDLRDIIGELDELDTSGAKLAAIGEQVVVVGTAMDAISTQLRTRCPAE